MATTTYDLFPDEDIIVEAGPDWSLPGEAVFYCTCSIDPQDPDNLRISARSAPNTCWKPFPSIVERDAHQQEAHAEEWAAKGKPYVQPILKTRGDVEPPMPSRGTGSPGDRPPWAMSEKQLRWITNLAAQKGVEVPEVTDQKGFTEAIERLQAMTDIRPWKPNKFAGACSECKGRVEAEKGMIRRDEASGKWLVAHAPSCPTDAPEVVEVSFDDGFYAVEADAGHLSFYKVTKGRKPGIVFVDLLLGGGPNGGYRRQKVPFTIVDTILTKIAKDPEGANKAFGLNSGWCMRCGRGLTNQESRRLGLGTECRRM